MFLEVLELLFLDSLCKVFRVKPSPTEIRLQREGRACSEAVLAGMHDAGVETYQIVFPKFRHHHDQARARHGLA